VDDDTVRQRSVLTTLLLLRARRASGANRDTLKGRFRRLVEHGTLERHGAGRGVRYSLR